MWVQYTRAYICVIAQLEQELNLQWKLCSNNAMLCVFNSCLLPKGPDCRAERASFVPNSIYSRASSFIWLGISSSLATKLVLILAEMFLEIFSLCDDDICNKNARSIGQFVKINYERQSRIFQGSGCGGSWLERSLPSSLCAVVSFGN